MYKLRRKLEIGNFRNISKVGVDPIAESLF